MTPTARTLDALRCGGWTAEKVEQRIPGTQITRDFLGCIDIIGVHEIEGTMGVQATSGTNHAARRNKALAEPRLLVWLRAGNRFQIVSWRKVGAKGKRKLWQARVEELNLQDFTATR